jgi:hypothetical protein
MLASSLNLSSLLNPAVSLVLLLNDPVRTGSFIRIATTLRKMYHSTEIRSFEHIFFFFKIMRHVRPKSKIVQNPKSKIK